MSILSSTLKEHSLLGLKDLSASEITSILDRADYWDRQEEKLVPALANKFIANMFFESSTRTRFSFEMAEKRLGAQVLNFAAANSSIEKGESIVDTVRTLEAMGMDAGVIRLKPVGMLQELAEQVNMPLINAGDGNNEHPTQALLDLYTMKKHFGEIKGLKVSIIGDIKHSRVARSNLWALQKLGAEVKFTAPDVFKAPELEAYAPYVSIDEAMCSDVVMMLRVQLERHHEGIIGSTEQYRLQYGLTEERAARLAPHVVIMHPAPINRNVEIDDAVVEHAQSRIFKQMSNGVPIRMAVTERAMR